MSKQRKLGTRRFARVARTCICDALEPRRLLCSIPLHHLPQAPRWSDAIEQQSASQQEGGPDAVDIVWTNRDTFSGASDNFFDDIFGTSAGAAQAVVDAAIAAWENVITSFNRADLSSTLQVTISIARDAANNFITGFGGAGGPAATAPADGKPRTGSITISAGNIVPGTPNDNNGWFLDPTPNLYEEFRGAILNPFSGSPTTGVGGELFSVVASEITHVLGLISPKAGGTGANWNG